MVGPFKYHGFAFILAQAVLFAVAVDAGEIGCGFADLNLSVGGQAEQGEQA